MCPSRGITLPLRLSFRSPGRSAGRTARHSLLDRRSIGSLTTAYPARRSAALQPFVPVHRRSIQSPRQEAYGHPDSDSYQVDSSLFEEEDAQYARSRDGQSPLSQALNGPDELLQSLLFKGKEAEATEALQQMIALLTHIEPQAHYANVALSYARRDDLLNSALWLSFIPTQWGCADDARPDVLKDLAELVQHLIASSDAERVWTTLLLLARLNYFEGSHTLLVAIADAFSWLMQHAYATNYHKNEPLAQWTLRLWEKVVTIAMRARIEQLMKQNKRKEQLAMQKMQQQASSPGSLIANLNRYFNLSIRALCRAYRFDAALLWIGSSDVAGAQTRQSNQLPLQLSYTLEPSTWYMFLVMLNRPNSSASDSIKINTEQLLHRLTEQDKGSNGPARRNANVLLRIADKARSAIESDATIDRGGGRVATLMAEIEDLMNQNKVQDALCHYCAHVRDKQLMAVAHDALPTDGYELLEKASARMRLSQLTVTPMTSSVGLRCLVDLYRDDHIRLQELYSHWIASVAHFQVTTERDPTASAALSEYGKVPSGIFEGQGPAAKAAVRPTESHFTAFMRRLPRALTSAGLVQAKKNRKAHASQWEGIHAESCRWAAQIMTDMERFGMAPSIGMLTLLLDVVARNVYVAQPGDATWQVDGEESNRLDFLWGLTRALQMGPTTDTGTTAEVAQTKAKAGKGHRATPLTYTTLIRAFLAIPLHRGGPLMNEARLVKGWLESDAFAQHELEDNPHLYEEVVKEADQALEYVQSRLDQREELIGALSQMQQT